MSKSHKIEIHLGGYIEYSGFDGTVGLNSHFSDVFSGGCLLGRKENLTGERKRHYNLNEQVYDANTTLAVNRTR